MRIVIDLQACQAAPRRQGMSRHSFSLTRALAHVAGRHDVFAALNALFPGTAAALRGELSDVLDPGRVVVFHAPGPTAEVKARNHWRARAAEIVRESFIRSVAPDVVHTCGPFGGFWDDCVGDSAHWAAGHIRSATLYDLIPLTSPDTLLPDTRMRTHYFRRLQSLKNSDLVLSISNYSKAEAVSLLGLDPACVINIGCAAGDAFRPGDLTPERQAALQARLGLSQPFVFYAPSGIDPRKNVNRLIEAFAGLASDVRGRAQLVIAGPTPNPGNDLQRELWAKNGERLGLGPRDLVITEFLEDEDLIDLYRLCDLFVFPSLQEGFGLPALEAMACGAAVIGSNTTSVPEVIGLKDALFDPASVADMTRALHKAFTDRAYRDELAAYGPRRAALFSWDSTAKKALAAIEEFHSARGVHRTQVPRRGAGNPGRWGEGYSGGRSMLRPYKNGESTPGNLKPRLAYVLPLPPVTARAAELSVRLVPELARYYDIELVTDQSSIADQCLMINFPIRTPAWFLSHGHHYDRVLYHLGADADYDFVWELMETHTGVIVLHDFFLGSAALRRAKKRGGMTDFQSDLYASHGYPALICLEKDGSEETARRYPCNGPVWEWSNGVIVHDADFMGLAESQTGPGHGANLIHIPIPVEDRSRVIPANGHGLRPQQSMRNRDLPKNENVRIPVGAQHPAPSFSDHFLRDGVSHTKGVGAIADVYREAIEYFAALGGWSLAGETIRSVARISSSTRPRKADLLAVADSIAANHHPQRGPRLFVDLSWLAFRDIATGMQRVARSITSCLVQAAPHPCRVEPIRFDGRRYRYARNFTLRLLGLPAMPLAEDEVVSPQPGDTILVPEMNPQLTMDDSPGVLSRFMDMGARIYWIVYDLLPIRRPEVFGAVHVTRFRNWLDAALRLADGLLCISRAVADDLALWLDEQRPDGIRELSIGYFHLGANLLNGRATRGLPPESAGALSALRARPAFLMVGTLEPRKGHGQALAAFETLWAAGVEANLVIVGKFGWMTEELVARIKSHPELARRLFLLEGISDEYLDAVYGSCTALIAASTGEGFGLPLIEAAQHGLPIIARDLPVFREVAGDHAFYFSGLGAGDLADALREWLQLCEEGRAPSSTDMPYLTWAQSAEMLSKVILEGNFYRVRRPR